LLVSLYASRHCIILLSYTNSFKTYDCHAPVSLN